MTETAIIVDRISKAYRIGNRRNEPDTLVGAAMSWVRSPLRNFLALRELSTGLADASDDAPDVVWALRDISFTVGRGQVIGIIGRNGAGKSTLLKVLSRITSPTHGRAVLRGRMASLLEVGTGFHPELTGRDNVFLNGAIMGMRRSEIERKFDDIVDFSGVARFIDTPVKRYSSGMYVRLAFAVAASLDPEILIIDEVLAVGDAAFQRRCLGKMQEVASSGRTVLFVSHQLASVQNLCSRCLVLDAGRVVADGVTSDSIGMYLQAVGNAVSRPLDERPDRDGNGDLRFSALRLYDDGGRQLAYLQTGADVVLELGYRNPRGVPLYDVHFAIGVDNEVGQRITLISSRDAGKPPLQLPASDGAVQIRIPRLPVLPGRYRLTLFAEVTGDIADWVREAVEITVEPGDYYNTGKLPPRHQGDFLMDYEMTAEQSAGVPTS